MINALGGMHADVININIKLMLKNYSGKRSGKYLIKD
jgi:hypothetical protein